jgi:hypothetical protein
MRNFFISLMIIVQLLTTTTSKADPIVLPSPPAQTSGEVDVGDAISPMKKGQSAPFTGVLLSPHALATIVVQLNSIPEQIKIEVDHVRSVDKANSDFQLAETTNRLETDKKILQAQIDSRAQQVNILTDVVKKQEANKSNTTLWVGVGVATGFVLGICLSALSIYAISQSSK